MNSKIRISKITNKFDKPIEECSEDIEIKHSRSSPTSKLEIQLPRNFNRQYYKLPAISNSSSSRNQ